VFSAPIGIFWTWGGWDDVVDWYDYLVTENMDQLGTKNNQDQWRSSLAHDRSIVTIASHTRRALKMRMEHFMFVLN
jgi:hypothetical protein